MVPLYVKAARLPAEGPLQSEIARLKALSPDPKRRAEAALALVQDRVRYVALSMGEGGLVPADAATTWSRRFGDCKGKTALLLALLRELSIDAEPVAVSTVLGDGMDERLPMVSLFDHVIVRARISGRDYWLDGTRTGDRNLDAIKVPAFGWGLPLSRGAALVRIMPTPLNAPMHEVSIRIDATKGLTVPAPARVEAVTRGDEALAINMGLSNLAGEARDRVLRDYWKEGYEFIEAKSVGASFDAEKGEHRLVLEGLARMDWTNGYYETDGTALGYKADFSRDPGPNRDAPFAVAYPYYVRHVETILLPSGLSGFKAGDNAEVSETIAGVEYRRRAVLTGNVFKIEASERSVAPEFPAKDAPAAQAALRALAERAVYLARPANYQPTEEELSAAMTATPSGAADLIQRGNMLLDAGRYDEAFVDFDRAVSLNSKDALALALRGLARVWKADTAAAAKDLDAAEAIKPRTALVRRARGLMAERNDQPVEAIAAYTAALEVEPTDAFSLGHRALVHRSSGDLDAALRDAAAAIRLRPGWTELYLMRANLLRRQKKQDQALAEAAAVGAANPNNPFAHVTAARIYAALGRQTESMSAFERALAIKPEAYIYLNRSQVRAKGDKDGRHTDVEAALRLEPKSTDALAAKAQLLAESGDHQGAIATWSAALAVEPKDGTLLGSRGLAYARAGRTALANEDFAEARVKVTEPLLLNNMCWEKAKAGVALEAALADCDAALRKEPDAPAFLDSRGLVLLRMGRIDEAIATYDRALAGQPNMGSSLFGRAVAWARKGDKAKSDMDLLAALKAYPEVEEDFAGYGVKR